MQRRFAFAATRPIIGRARLRRGSVLALILGRARFSRSVTALRGELHAQRQNQEQEHADQESEKL